MSALSSASLTASLGSAPYVDPAREPAQIRHGDQAAKTAYQEGLGFEQVLVNQLAQQMTATVPGLGGSDGSDGSDGSSSGDAGGSSSGLGPFASMLPQALTSGIMAGGGTGLAMQIARDLDPSLDHPSAKAAS